MVLIFWNTEGGRTSLLALAVVVGGGEVALAVGGGRQLLPATARGKSHLPGASNGKGEVVPPGQARQHFEIFPRSIEMVSFCST